MADHQDRIIEQLVMDMKDEYFYNVEKLYRQGYIDEYHFEKALQIFSDPFAGEYGYDDEGSTYTRDDIDMLVKNSGIKDGFLVVYANWCGACKGLFGQTGVEVNSEGFVTSKDIPNVLFIESEELNKKALSIEHYPTIFIIKDGKVTKDDGRERFVKHMEVLVAKPEDDMEEYVEFTPRSKRRY